MLALLSFRLAVVTFAVESLFVSIVNAKRLPSNIYHGSKLQIFSI